jgi:hypothetical protein
MKTAVEARYNPPSECYSSARRQMYEPVTHRSEWSDSDVL